MHHLSPCFQFSPPVPKYRFKYRQNAPFTVAVSIFSAFPNRLKYCHKAPFTSLVFIFFFFAAVQNKINTTRVHALKTISINDISLQYQIFSNTGRMHAYSETFSKFTLQCQIVPNTITMHALEKLFSKFSLQFQIVSNSVRTHALETLFSFVSVVPNRFKFRQNARFREN